MVLKKFTRRLFTQFYRHLLRRLFQRDVMLEGMQKSLNRNVPAALTHACLTCARAECHTDVFGSRSDRVLQNAWLNSFHPPGLKNLLDKAVLENVADNNPEPAQPQWRKIDEIPFDFSRRRMSVIVAGDDGIPHLICKGALEEILGACSRVRHDDEIMEMMPSLLGRIGNVTEDQLRCLQRWRTKELGRFMVYFGPISSIFDILTFCPMWWVFKADTPEKQTLFQTGWFVVGVLSQTLIVHMLRTRKIPFLQSRPSWPLGLTTLTVIVLTVGMTFTPVAGFLHLQALPLGYFPWLMAILAAYMLLVQAMKGWYVRRYGWQ